MGYERPRWIDPYTYCALLDEYGVNCNLSWTSRAAAAATPPQADPVRLEALRTAAELIAATGMISLTDGGGRIMSLALQPASAVFADNIAKAEQRLARLAAAEIVSYTLEVQNASGAPLHVHPVTPNEADEQGSVATFTELIPWPAAAVKVALKGDGALLDVRIASVHAPSVRVLSPNGGESLQPPAVVRWEATDADDDPLSFHILYSPDAGVHWRAIALDVIGRAYTLTAGAEGSGWLPGSGQALMRVVASDGVHAVHDDSDGLFVVPGAAPSVAIQHPVNGSWHRAAAALLLDGLAEDADDGLLGGAGLTWRSDRDGALGAGEELLLPAGRLSIGPHRITLTATDRDGTTGVATVEITILPELLYLPVVYR
jgi:hypothetical protein